MSDKQFAKGIWYNEPFPNAPEYVIGSLSIDIIQFRDFINTFKDERIRLKILKSKDGKPYLEVDTWKASAPKEEIIYNKEPEKKLAEIQEDDGLPF